MGEDIRQGAGQPDGFVADDAERLPCAEVKPLFIYATLTWFVGMVKVRPGMVPADLQFSGGTDTGDNAVSVRMDPYA